MFKVLIPIFKAKTNGTMDLFTLLEKKLIDVFIVPKFQGNFFSLRKRYREKDFFVVLAFLGAPL